MALNREWYIYIIISMMVGIRIKNMSSDEKDDIHSFIMLFLKYLVPSAH